MSKYLLIDNLSRNIEHSQLGKITKMVDWCLKNQNPILACILDRQKEIEVGDMCCFRDELIENGFKLWKDFSIKKLDD